MRKMAVDIDQLSAFALLKRKKAAKVDLSR
jgi:hypothetical protein